MPKLNQLYNMDCMDGLREIPDKYFELAVVDPPYRDKHQPTDSMRKAGDMKAFGKKPDFKFFAQLFRVSKNQILWGANNFIEYLRSTNCFIFWYKHNPLKNYSAGELAWTSFASPARCFDFVQSGAHIAEDCRNYNRIHPTQKPLALYRWLYSNYAKPGDKILDPMAGSASSFIAAWEMGLEYVGFEINPDYYKRAMERITQIIDNTKGSKL